MLRFKTVDQDTGFLPKGFLRKESNEYFDEKGTKIMPSKYADHEGRKYRVLAEKNLSFSTKERIGRGSLGFIAVIASFGLALISKDIQSLFQKNLTLQLRIETSNFGNEQVHFLGDDPQDQPPVVNQQLQDYKEYLVSISQKENRESVEISQEALIDSLTPKLKDPSSDRILQYEVSKLFALLGNDAASKEEAANQANIVLSFLKPDPMDDF